MSAPTINTEAQTIEQAIEQIGIALAPVPVEIAMMALDVVKALVAHHESATQAAVREAEAIAAKAAIRA